MMKTIGALTTTFTPSPSCTNDSGYTEFADKNGGSYLVKGPVTTAGCYPPGFKTEPSYLYTPGQCPSGYTLGCFYLLDISSVPVTSGYCCPVLATGAFGCGNPKRVNATSTVPSGFPCRQVISSTTTTLPVTIVSDGTTLSTVTSTITAATIGAYGIQIQYSQDDDLERPPDPERFNNVRLSFPSHVDTRDPRLSPEARVGIGIGTCFAIGLIGAGILFFLKRSRKSLPEKDAASTTTVSRSDTHSCTPRIHRKRAAISISSQLKKDVPDKYAEYHTVSIHDCEDKVRKYTPPRPNGISLWSWEILSLLLGTLSLACMIVILRVYEGRQLEEWTPDISINAVISILSALFKGSLALPITEGISQLKWMIFAQKPQNLSDLDVYDKASRGAWGSAMMIFGTSKSGPRAYLASFGAALGIVALATNPFAQATISLYSCMRNGTESASIPRANHFSVEREGYNEMDARTFDAPMQLASYRGLLEPPENRSTSVTVSCTSGNCTFPSHDGASFLSLTMCSRAWDISDRIAINDTKINYVYSIGPGVTLPEKSVFAMDYVEAPDTGFSVSKYDHWNRTSIVDVYVLSMTKDNSTDCIAPQCLSFMGGHFKPSAFVFSLFPCIHTVYATMKYGRYEEKVVSEQYLHWISRADGGTYQLAVNRTMMDGTWQDCVGTTTANSMNTVAVYVKKDSATEPSKMWYAPECVFGFTGSTALSQFLGPSLFRTKSQTETARSSWVSKLWRKGTTDLALVANFAEGLATSLGAHMRASASGPDMLREARGTTQLTKTCFNIRWGYVAFFISIYTLELLFLATLIVMSYKSKVHTDWKSSSLAIAFLTAENTRRPELHADNPNSEESLRQAAQSVQAQLCDESGHWQLRTRRRV